MAREVHLTCDDCSRVEIYVGYEWPNGWYHWHRRDLCHACAAPQIIAALRDCVLQDEDEIPRAIGP